MSFSFIKACFLTTDFDINLYRHAHTHTRKNYHLAHRTQKSYYVRMYDGGDVWLEGVFQSQRSQAKIDGFLTKIKHRSETKYNSVIIYSDEGKQTRKWSEEKQTHTQMPDYAWLFTSRIALCVHVHTHTHTHRI